MDLSIFLLLAYVYIHFLEHFFQIFIRNTSIDETTVCTFNLILTYKIKCVKAVPIIISGAIINDIIYPINIWSNKFIFYNNNTIFFFVFMRVRIIVLIDF